MKSIDEQIREAERAGDLERVARLQHRIDGSKPLAGLIATCTASGGNYQMTFRLHSPGVNPRGLGWQTRARNHYIDDTGRKCYIPSGSIGNTVRCGWYQTAARLEELGATVPALEDWRMARSLAPPLDRAALQGYVRGRCQARKEPRLNPGKGYDDH